MSDKLIKTIDQIIKDISHDTYLLTDEDINKLEWHLRDVQNLIKETYGKRGENLI